MQEVLGFKNLFRKILAFLFPTEASGLGTFSGVYIPSVLMMLGVIFYLRLGWITGNVGGGQMSLIITLSTLLLIITALSMTSIVSNMKVGGGGAYYMISRSLGIELGSAVGIALSLCQCMSTALCISGFAESIHNLLPQFPLVGIEIASVMGVALLTFFSTNLTLTTQFIIALVIAASFVSVFTGGGSRLEASAATTLPLLGFWGAFAMFFPATTGIEAGMAMSGTLKNPARSLPLGIIGSLLTVYVLYLALGLFFAHVAPAELLRSDTFIAFKIASVPQLILIGIWGATLSSAFSCFLGSSRMIQAIAEDGVLPKFFARTYGPQNEPRIAIAAIFIIALLINLCSTINQLIPIVAMICLISYGCLNFIVYFEEILKNPSWRPNFRIPWIIPLIGGFGCFGVMWMINPLMTIVGLIVVIGIYAWVSWKNIHSDWHDLRYSLLFYLYRTAVYRLARTPVQARNWRPHILAFTPSPLSRETLIHFSHSLSQGKGYLVFASIFPDYFSDEFPLDSAKKVFEDFLEKKKIPSLVEVCSLKTGYRGIDTLIKGYSFGVLQPNTVILPAPEKEATLKNFGQVVFTTLESQKNLLIVRDQAEDSYATFCEHSPTKKIDIWWEGNNRYNFDLILSIYSTLHSDPIWKGVQATVKMIVDSETARENLLNYFDTFRANNRLDIEVQIYMLPEQDDIYSMISYLSQDTDLTFLGLRSPKEEETPDHFAAYFKNLEEKLSSLRTVVYVLHGERLDLREMWQFESET